MQNKLTLCYQRDACVRPLLDQSLENAMGKNRLRIHWQHIYVENLIFHTQINFHLQFDGKLGITTIKLKY